MSEKVTAWLEELGLGRYATTFEKNELDLDQLIDLSDEDMKDLGITIMGHRKKLFRAIKDLSVQTEPHINQNDTTALSSLTGPISRIEAERRQLTVMFCDLVGSTSLAEQLDPEDLRDIIRSYQDECTDAISRFEGYVARYVGDGLLVYFGFPRAHEGSVKLTNVGEIGVRS